jgi:FtsZ-binding cell division protein ZapB
MAHLAQKLDEEDVHMLNSLREVYSTSNNYHNYRELLKKTNATCTPYIGLYLRDLTFTDDGNPNQVEGLINFKKRTMISRVLMEIKRFQGRSYSFKAIPEIIAPISRYEQINEGDAYDASRRIEPKDPFSTIEELLTNQRELKSKRDELVQRLSALKEQRTQLQAENRHLRQEADGSFTTPWRRRFAPPPHTSPGGKRNRKLLLCRNNTQA